MAARPNQGRYRLGSSRSRLGFLWSLVVGVVALVCVGSTVWGSGISHLTIAPSNGVALESASVSVSGFVCRALPDVPGPNATGCGGYAPVSYAMIYLSNWSVLSSGPPQVWAPDPWAVPQLESGRASQNGSFALPYSGRPGPSVLWTPNSSNEGGGFVTLNLTGYAESANIVVYPFVPQGNVSYTLPAWNNLSAYAFNGNCAGCGGYTQPGTGSQVPMLAWTQDGVFYVNATYRLVFYSFAAQTITDIAPWWPLYDNYLFYHGVENTEWITSDGSYVYEMGCASLCVSNSTVAVYAVNVTTGRTFSHNFTEFTAHSLSVNGQVNLIGSHGNSSIVAVTVANLSAGDVYAWDLWGTTEWKLGTLPYFETNNDEWVPQLDSFINVEAQGSTGDHVEQVELEGSGPASHLVEVASLMYWTGRTPVNGENWGGYNVTTHQVVINSGYTGSTFGTFVFTTTYSPTYGTYVLSSLARSYLGISQVTPVMQVQTSSQRATVLASGFLPGGIGTATLYNNTPYDDPFNGMFLNTNVTLGKVSWMPQPGGGGYWQGGSGSVFAEGLFYTSAYQLSDYSIDCRGSLHCSLNGEAAPQPFGTVDWIWSLNGPQFPYPSASPLAEPVGPSAPTHLEVSRNSTTASVFWSPPSTGAHPILNYTFRWGLTSGFGHTVSLPATASSYAIPLTDPASSVYYSVQAWNLHGPGAVVTNVSATVVYPVTFQEAGLPNGTAWAISLAEVASGPILGATFTFYFPTGTYPYRLADVPGWHQSSLPYEGNQTVASGPLTETPFVFARTTYAVTFLESGLPTSTNWSVTLGNVSRHSTTDVILFTLPNGSHPFQVPPVGPFVPSSSAGTVTVNGTSLTYPLFFRIPSPPTYLVAFHADGLPNGVSWVVEFNGSLGSSDTPWIYFSSVSGDYPFAVALLSPGWSAAPSSGRASVTHNTTIAVQVLSHSPAFSLFLTENGVPAGIDWSVNLSGITYTSEEPTLFVTGLAPGHYSWAVTPPTGYRAQPAGGEVSLLNRSISLGVTFSPVLYAVTFTERGLPAGTLWAVEVNGVVLGSTTTSITFWVGPGSFLYRVGYIAGWSPDLGGGTVTVTGAMSLAITFTGTG